MRKRSRSASTHADPLLPCMLSCFNIKLGLDGTASHFPHTLSGSNAAANNALKKGLISIKKQSDSVLHLDVGHVSKASVDLRRLSFDSNSSPSDSSGPHPNKKGRSSMMRPNQDVVAVQVGIPKSGGRTSLFGVFDGHGRNGGNIAAFIANVLVRKITGGISGISATTTMPMDRNLRRAAFSANEMLRSFPSFDISMSGTTSTLCTIENDEVTCANIGDSRIMLASYGYIQPIALTYDHVPFRPDEQTRITEAGGRVERWNPLPGMDMGPPRVYLANSRLPGLAVSRAFGDTILDGIITCKPEITRIRLEKHHSFLVLASDGLWCMMDMHTVNDFVARRRDQPAQKVAEMLVEHCVELWVQAGESHSDDISVVLVFLERGDA